MLEVFFPFFHHTIRHIDTSTTQVHVSMTNDVWDDENKKYFTNQRCIYQIKSNKMFPLYLEYIWTLFLIALKHFI